MKTKKKLSNSFLIVYLLNYRTMQKLCKKNIQILMAELKNTYEENCPIFNKKQCKNYIIWLNKKMNTIFNGQR